MGFFGVFFGGGWGGGGYNVMLLRLSFLSCFLASFVLPFLVDVVLLLLRTVVVVLLLLSSSSPSALI